MQQNAKTCTCDGKKVLETAVTKLEINLSGHENDSEKQAKQNFPSFQNKQSGCLIFCFIILTSINESRKCIPSEWMLSAFLIINIYNINASRIRPELMKRIVNI